jgi:sulfatase modifying factor 1
VDVYVMLNRLWNLASSCSLLVAGVALGGCSADESAQGRAAAAVPANGIALHTSPEADSDAPAPLLVAEPDVAPAGMVWVAGGSFTMGTNFEVVPENPNSMVENPDRIKQDEYPPHRVELDGFWMKATPVTNREFAEFVEMTGFRTFAERTPTREDLLRSGLAPTQPIPKEALRPTSICFKKNFDPKTLVIGPQNWEYQVWELIEGADWRHPEGPNSNIDDRPDHPVVHINFDDARAYCEWAGVSLPTEAQFEYAARSGGKPVKYPWGNGITTDDQEMCNYFQGTFPTEHLNKDGFLGTSPVKSFPPNEIGLYDMAGNVWEWCSDLYDARYYWNSPVRNPQGPEVSFDPASTEAEARAVKRVQRGGSFMFNVNNCTGYRCAARMRGEEMSSSFHTGFRSVVNPSQLETYRARQKAIEVWRASRP